MNNLYPHAIFHPYKIKMSVFCGKKTEPSMHYYMVVSLIYFLLCLCLSQGVVIFIMFFLRPKEVRKAVAPYLGWLFCCLTCRTASNTKTEDVGLATITGGTNVTQYENSVSGNDNPHYESPSPVYERSINPH